MGICLSCIDLQETIEACEVKVGTYSKINEYMTIYDDPKVKVIHWPLSKVTQDFFS